MTRLRCSLSLFLAVSLALATLGFGVARGQAMAAGEIVLCTGHGAVTVQVDSDGNPVRTIGLCPDAALSFHAGPGLAPPEAPTVTVQFSRLVRAERSLVPPALTAPLTRGARAPPA